jgi:hypothetical protein
VKDRVISSWPANSYARNGSHISKGTRWETLQALIEYCSLQWPIVAAKIEKRAKNLLLRRLEASARLVGVEVAPAPSPGWVQLANSLTSIRLTTSRTGFAISVERQVILPRFALIGILEGRLTRTRSRKRARKMLRTFRISRQYRTTS